LKSYPEAPKAIDWAYYNQNIIKPNMVEDFQKKYGALSIPYPKDTKSAAIDAKEREEVRLPSHVLQNQVTVCILSLGPKGS